MQELTRFSRTARTASRQVALCCWMRSAPVARHDIEAQSGARSPELHGLDSAAASKVARMFTGTGGPLLELAIWCSTSMPSLLASLWSRQNADGSNPSRLADGTSVGARRPASPTF